MIVDNKRVAPFTGAWIETMTPNTGIEEGEVAPFTGAWIETAQHLLVMGAEMLSRPSRARGLKPVPNSPRCHPSHVAPFTGAWIETSRRSMLSCKSKVAPFAGAWIDTRSLRASLRPLTRRALHGRVDKWAFENWV